MLAILEEWPWYTWFSIGFTVAFLMTSQLLSWRARQVENQNNHLRELVAELTDEVRKANKLLELQ